MKIRQNYLKVGGVLTALPLILLADPALADHLIPFEGDEAGAVISDVLPFAFPFAFDRMTGAGEATPVGPYTLTGDLAANVLFGTATGTFTMTTANGDMLFLDGEGFVLQPDLIKLVWNYTVTGGTGRFEGETGTITENVQLSAIVGSISPNPYVATLTGSISPVPDAGRGYVFAAAASLAGFGLLTRGRKPTSVGL